MPPPEPESSPRVRREPQQGGRPGPTASQQRTTGGRQRPAPSSALAPSPTPLMPVPDPDPDGDHRPAVGPGHGRTDHDPTPGKAGRRQYRQRNDRSAAPTGPAPSSEELVYLSGRVPRGLRDELHIRAIHDGRPIVELLRDAIRQYLDDHSRNRSQ
jgi:hypothetical protein